MSFNSINYLIFLPLVSMGYFAIPKKYRNIYLLAVSYYFYWCNEVRFFLLLPLLTAATYLAGRSMDKAQPERKKWIFLAGMGLNLGILVFFKYNRFFLNTVSSATGIEFDLTKWMLPMGISFYVFMAVSYLADLMLGKYKSEPNFVKFAVYISFFPHCLMGPIDRANKFLPQLDKDHSFDYERVRKALQLMAIGFFKKIAVADVMAMFINQVHSDLTSYAGLMLIFTAFMYSFQLYADFSGYSDIARASAMIMDIDIRENFKVPYLATNFSQFWNKWHISLSSCFQDYIFTPFVWYNPLKKLPVIGSKFEKPPVLAAITLVFLTSGVWHGNTWNFVVWGGCHAVYRIGEELLKRHYRKPAKNPPMHIFWGKVCGVFTLVTFSQIFFRAKDLPSAWYYLTHLFSDLSLSTFAGGLYNSVKYGFDATPLLIYAYMAFNAAGLALLIAMDFYRHFRLKGKCLTLAFDKMPKWQRWLCYYCLIAFIMAGFIINNGGYGASASFIYNNF